MSDKKGLSNLEICAARYYELVSLFERVKQLLFPKEEEVPALKQMIAELQAKESAEPVSESK